MHYLVMIENIIVFILKGLDPYLKPLCTVQTIPIYLSNPVRKTV